jgi:hypothetical protein
LCFWPRWCSQVKLYSCRCWIQWAVCPLRFLKLMSQLMQSGRCTCKTLVSRGTYGNVPVSS